MNENINSITRALDIVDTFKRASNSLTTPILEIDSLIKFIEIMIALMTDPSTAVLCERITDEFKRLMLNVAESRIRAVELNPRWKDATLRLLAIYSMILQKSSLNKNDPQIAFLAKKFDAEFIKWNDIQANVKKSASALVLNIRKLATITVYMREPVRSTVSNFSVDAAVAGKSFRKSWEAFAELKESFLTGQVQMHSERNEPSPESTDANSETLIPDGCNAILDFVIDNLKNSITTLNDRLLFK